MAKVRAVIEADSGTLLVDFPQGIYALYEKLRSVGIRHSPSNIPIADEEDGAIRVKLYAEDDVGKRLTLLFSEDNTLAEVNTTAFVMENTDPEIRPQLEENLLRYSFRLGGQSAEDAKLLSIAYSAANGQSGVLDANGGALTLQSGADGKNAYTISMLTEVTSGGRTRQLTFTFLLEWREEQDLRLNLVWMKNSTEAQSIVCEPGDRASAEIRRTELKLGEFSYQLQPDGRDAAQMTITSASLAAEGGTAQTLAVPDDSTVLRIPDGAASIKYTLTVQARYQKSDGSLKNLTFTYVLRYSGDVSLELRYTLLNGTQTAIRCANGQNKTADRKSVV